MRAVFGEDIVRFAGVAGIGGADSHFSCGVSEVRAAKELVAFFNGVAGDGVDSMVDRDIDAADDRGFIGLLGRRLQNRLRLGGSEGSRSEANRED